MDRLRPLSFSFFIRLLAEDELAFLDEGDSLLNLLSILEAAVRALALA